MANIIERLLNLRRGDFGRGILLFIYLFLIIASYVVGKAARDAMFLAEFGAKDLPYADITVAISVGIVVSLYVAIARRTTVRNLLIGSLLLFASNCLLFWWIAHFHYRPWIYPTIYIWVGIFGVLGPAQVWTLANYVLTTREAKRLFGVISAGAIAGWIFGGFSTKFMAKAFGTESLLVTMAIAFTICAGLVAMIWRQRETAMALAPEDSGHAAEGEAANLRESLKLVFSSKYLRAIAAIICLSSIATTIAGWQFKAISSQFIPQKDALAVFFGDFNFYAGMLALAIQFLLTSRLLRRFGIGPALFMVPVVLMAGSAGVLFFGTLAAAIALKGGEQVVRYSIDKPSVELLYLPLASDVKVQVKSFIDTVIWRFGDGLAGVLVLIFATQLHWTARQVSLVNLIMIGTWMVAALVARRQYVVTLRDSIRQHRLDAERASTPVLDRSATQMLADNLGDADPQEILYALGLFEMSNEPALHPAVRGLLSHSNAEVRKKAIITLSRAGDTTVRGDIERLLRDPDFHVRTEALHYLTYHAHIDPLARIEELGDFPDYSIRSGIVAFLARPGEMQNLDAAHTILKQMVDESGPEGQLVRLEAARLISILPDHFEHELTRLLGDEDVEVAEQAIVAAGKLRKRRHLPLLLERLSDDRLAPAVSDALAAFGDSIVGTLRDHLVDTGLPGKLRGRVVAILSAIGSRAAVDVLLDNMLDNDAEIRFRVIAALNKLRTFRPDTELDPQMIEAVLAAEIMGHYRSSQILARLGDSSDPKDPVTTGLKSSMGQELERIFRLLSLMYPNYDFHSAYFGLQSADAVVHANALEFLDNVLKPQLRNVLVPLLDSEVPLRERANLGERILRAKLESDEEAVAALLRSHDAWLRTCGAYAAGKLGLQSLEGELDACLASGDTLLRETARQAKARIAGRAAAHA
jgi:AAA family ATP:ADP antiporter